MKLKTPFTYMIAGASQSGKTVHVFNLLAHRHQIFDRPTDAIYYFYNCWQPHFDQFASRGLVTEWINELPTYDLIMEKSASHVKKDGCVFVVDDFMDNITTDIMDLFTVYAHSYRINVIFLTQNLFAKNLRDISLNATYIVVFKNPRDQSQIQNLAQQLRPKKWQYIMEAYDNATKRPYTYLLFDNHQTTPDYMRVRTRLFPKEGYMQVFYPIAKKEDETKPNGTKRSRKRKNPPI